MSGRVCCGFGGVSLSCVWDRFWRFWGSEFLLCLGAFCVVLGSEILLCVGEFGAGLGELVFCCVCERLVWV